MNKERTTFGRTLQTKARSGIRSSSTVAAQRVRPAFSPKNRDLTGKRPPGVDRAEGRIARAEKGAMIQRSGSYERKQAKDNDLLYEGDTVNTAGKGDAVVKPRGGKRVALGRVGMTKVGRR